MDLYIEIGGCLVGGYCGVWLLLGVYNLLLFCKTFINDSKFNGWLPAFVKKVVKPDADDELSVLIYTGGFLIVYPIFALLLLYPLVALFLIGWGAILTLRSIRRLQKGVKKLNEHKHLKGKVVFKEGE